MTIEFFPFDAGSGANITETQWRRMAKYWRTSGVLPDNMDYPLQMLNGGTTDNNDLFTEFLVTGSSSQLAVNVGAGAAWVRGHFFRSDSTVTLPITANTDPNNYNRIDRVVVRLDTVANTMSLAVKQGTPASSPTPPALSLNENGQYEIPLAKVTVPTTATVGTQLTIEDERIPSLSQDLFYGARLWNREGIDSAQTLTNAAYTNITFAQSWMSMENMVSNSSIWIPMDGFYLCNFVFRTTGNSGMIGTVCATQKGQPLTVSSTNILGRAEVKEGCVSVVTRLTRDQVVWAAIYNGSGASQSTVLMNTSVPSLTVVRLGD